MGLFIEFIYWIVSLYSLLLIVHSLLSWFPQVRWSKWTRFLDELVEPVLRPFRRFNLVFFGLDWTPVVALLVIRWAARYLTMILAFLL